MKSVMIDLETLGNGKNACTVQIGACYFDNLTGEIGRKFKLNIDAESAEKAGMQLDASTVKWWLQQSPEAIKSITADPKTDFLAAFIRFNAFLSDAEEIWSHATFDFVILTETLKHLGISPKFSFRAARDIRTLMSLAKINPKDYAREGVHHDALDDAIFQIKYVVDAISVLRTH